MEKKHSPATYFRASDILKNITSDCEHCMCKFQSAWEKSLPHSCAPKAKLPALNYWFRAKVSSIFENTERMKRSVQLTLRYSTSTPGKRNSISAKKDLLVRNSTSLIAYRKTLCEYARGIRYVFACLLNFFK